MVWQLAGAALGTGMSMYGADKKKDALRGASGAYAARVAQLMRERQLMNREQDAEYSQLEGQRQGDMSQAIGGYLGAERNVNTQPFAADAQSAVASLAKAAPGASAHMQTGGAQMGAQQMQSQQSQNRLQLAMAAAQAREGRAQTQQGQQGAMQPFRLNELTRASQLRDLNQQYSLRDLLMQQGFSMDQNRLQEMLDGAGRAGDHAMMWGGLMQGGSQALMPEYGEDD